MFNRHYAGEGLESLNLKELHSVEQQIDTALKRIRTKKVKPFHFYFFIFIFFVANKTQKKKKKFKP